VIYPQRFWDLQHAQDALDEKRKLYPKKSSATSLFDITISAERFVAFLVFSDIQRKKSN
jgi:hypothetical protein